MGMGFAPTWLRRVSPLLHKTTLTTAQHPLSYVCTIFTQSGGLSGLERKERHSQAHHYCNLAFPGLKERFFRGNARFQAGNIVIASDVNKDWTYKDKDKDLNLVLKESLRTRTRINITGYAEFFQ